MRRAQFVLRRDAEDVHPLPIGVPLRLSFESVFVRVGGDDLFVDDAEPMASVLPQRFWVGSEPLVNKRGR